MIVASHSRNIDAPAESAWKAISELDGIDKWHPEVKKSILETEKSHGVGASRKCDFYSGMSLVETVTHWNEGKSVTLELSQMNMPLKQAFVTLAVSPNGRQSKVTISMDLQPKYGPLGWMMGQVMMKPMMKKLFKSAIDGLEKHLATGSLIGPNSELVNIK